MFKVYQIYENTERGRLLTLSGDHVRVSHIVYFEKLKVHWVKVELLMNPATGFISCVVETLTKLEVWLGSVQGATALETGKLSFVSFSIDSSGGRHVPDVILDSVLLSVFFLI
jgi:hypothetical protein